MPNLPHPSGITDVEKGVHTGYSQGMALSARRLLGMVFAILTIAGLTLSTAQASQMSTNMAATSAMSPDMDGCDHCIGGMQDDGSLAACPANCLVPCFGILPQASWLPGTALSPKLTAALPDYFQGLDTVPDPSPPRPDTLG